MNLSPTVNRYKYLKRRIGNLHDRIYRALNLAGCWCEESEIYLEVPII